MVGHVKPRGQPQPTMESALWAVRGVLTALALPRRWSNDAPGRTSLLGVRVVKWEACDAAFVA